MSALLSARSSAAVSGQGVPAGSASLLGAAMATASGNGAVRFTHIGKTASQTLTLSGATSTEVISGWTGKTASTDI